MVTRFLPLPMCFGTDESKRTKGKIMKEIVFTTGLGIGEETKGASVKWLTEQFHAHTNLRSGGCQSGHFVVNEDGQEQMFDLFGSGTFSGAQTYLKNMVIDPIFLFREAIELEKKGIVNPFNKISIDQNCLSITPYHGALSRVKELLKGEDKKGTTGIGVGEAIRDSSFSDLTIRTKDFFDNRNFLTLKVESIRQYKLKQAQELVNQFPSNKKIPDQVFQELNLLNNQKLVESVVDSFQYLKDLVAITNEQDFDDLLNRDGAIVCEASHGALLHPYYGFVPHVTQVDPTARNLIKSVKDRDYSGKIIKLGISRCYSTRHGAGPLVSYDPQLTQAIQESPHNNQHNDWLGEFRNGAYDVVSMRYALDISGGQESFTGLKISYLDVLSKFSQWPVCEAYYLDSSSPKLTNYFDFQKDLIVGIKKYQGISIQDQIDHQTKLTQFLKQCKPVINYLKPTPEKKLDQVFIDYVEEKLNLPVVAVAYGPKSSDRQFRVNLT